MEGGTAEALRTLRLLFALCVVLILISVCNASKGDRHPDFRSCKHSCETTGLVNNIQLPSCNGMNPGNKSQNYALYSLFGKWDCRSECQYLCMKDTEAKGEAANRSPMKYYGKWPFDRYMNLQEPASVIFSLLNLLAHLQGVWCFIYLLQYSLPQYSRAGKYPPFTTIWIIYAGFAINSWVWSAAFHARDLTITERLDYSSAVALLGYTLILTILRTANLLAEAAQVLVAAPIIAFTVTHIMYLNVYDFDYGLNMKVCVIIGVTQLLLWTVWAGVTNHPARYKLWCVVLGTVLAMLLEIFDFPPFWGVLDAHALWHACTLPITVLWWGFIQEDLSLRISTPQRVVEAEARKVQ